MFALDRSNAFHARAADRLTREGVGWIVTVDADGTPEPSPVWFLWDGADKLLTYSLDSRKVRNIARRPRVSFHLNSTEAGADVVIFTGSAVADEAQGPATGNRAYIEKYAEGIKGIGISNEEFATNYKVPIVITIEKLRGF